MADIERRYQSSAELRSAEGRIHGYAAVFYDGKPGTQFELWPGAVERIMPGAFDRAVREDDVLGLFNHEPDNILGRTSAGTLVLRVDEVGLAYEIQPGPDELSRRVRSKIKRRELQGSSFSFRITDQEWRKENDLRVREVRGVKLLDVGPVTFPAYPATSVQARAACEQWEKARHELASRLARIAIQARILEMKD